MARKIPKGPGYRILVYRMLMVCGEWTASGRGIFAACKTRTKIVASNRGEGVTGERGRVGEGGHGRDVFRPKREVFRKVI